MGKSGTREETYPDRAEDRQRYILTLWDFTTSTAALKRSKRKLFLCLSHYHCIGNPSCSVKDAIYARY